MSTNASIAIPAGDGWQGRHTHWDGDPQWVGRNVWTIVQRDGLARARQVLTGDYYGWSVVYHDQPNIEGIKTYKCDAKLAREEPWKLREKYGSPRHPRVVAANWDDNGQFINVPGYGVAYSHEPLPDHQPFSDGTVYQQSFDTWVKPEETADWIEWVYLLADNGLWVLKGHHQEPFTLHHLAPWTEPEPSWVALYNRYAYPEGVDHKGKVVCDLDGNPYLSHLRSSHDLPRRRHRGGNVRAMRTKLIATVTQPDARPM